MTFKNWPSWLRGGVIAGGITFVFVFLYYSCSFLVSGYSGMLCVAFVMIGPIYPAGLILNLLGPVFHYSSGFAEANMVVFSVPFWFIIGSLIGALVGYIKSRK